MKAAPIRLIVPRLPFWSMLSSEEQAIVSERAVVKNFGKGQLVSSNTSECLGIVFILEGEIRVSMTSDEGREVVTRMLREFADKGFVEIRRGAIKLRNVDGLRNLI